MVVLKKLIKKLISKRVLKLEFSILKKKVLCYIYMDNRIDPFSVINSQLKMGSEIQMEEVKMIINSIYTLVCGGVQGEVGTYIGKRECNNFIRNRIIETLSGPPYTVYPNNETPYYSSFSKVPTEFKNFYCISSESCDEIIFFLGLFVFAWFYFLK